LSIRLYHMQDWLDAPSEEHLRVVDGSTNAGHSW